MGSLWEKCNLNVSVDQRPGSAQCQLSVFGLGSTKERCPFPSDCAPEASADIAANCTHYWPALCFTEGGLSGALATPSSVILGIEHTQSWLKLYRFLSSEGHSKTFLWLTNQAKSKLYSCHKYCCDNQLIQIFFFLKVEKNLSLEPSQGSFFHMDHC